jgi:hypothetical protein
MLRKGAGGRAVHDIGGLSLGAIDRSQHDLALWEKRTDALVALLKDNERRVLSVDAHRRMIECYGEQEYDRVTYYEEWIGATGDLLGMSRYAYSLHRRLALPRAMRPKGTRNYRGGPRPPCQAR